MSDQESGGVSRRDVLKGLGAAGAAATGAGCVEDAEELLGGSERPNVSDNDTVTTTRPQDTPSHTPSPTASAKPTESDTPTPKNTDEKTPTQIQNEETGDELAGLENYHEDRIDEEEYRQKNGSEEFRLQYDTLDEFTDAVLNRDGLQKGIDEAEDVGEILDTVWHEVNHETDKDRQKGPDNAATDRATIRLARHVMENLHHLEQNLEFNYSNLVVMDHTAASGGLFDAGMIMYETEDGGEWEIRNAISGGDTSETRTTLIEQSEYFNGEATQYSRLHHESVEDTVAKRDACEGDQIDKEDWALLGNQRSNSFRYNDDDEFTIETTDKAGHELDRLLQEDKKGFVDMIRQMNHDANYKEGKGNYMIDFSEKSEQEISPRAGEGMDPFTPKAAGNTEEFGGDVEDAYC